MTAKKKLKHPQGKNAISMDRVKYDLIKPAMLKAMRSAPGVSFGQMTKVVAKDFKGRGIAFRGSLPWHVEWVKLDLEARKVIRRIPGTSPQKYKIVR